MTRRQYKGLPGLGKQGGGGGRARPRPWQDNEYVFGELQGISSRQIADLVEGKVIY
jgi:hypothetical protein